MNGEPNGLARGVLDAMSASTGNQYVVALIHHFDPARFKMQRCLSFEEEHPLILILIIPKAIRAG